MPSIASFSGLGSGIDFSLITDSIIAQKRRPIYQLEDKKALYTQRSTALKTLNAKLFALKDAANALANQQLGEGRFTGSSNAATLTASGTETAAFGSTSIDVTRLATNYAEASVVYGSATAPVLAGAATTATFELRKGGAATGTAITIDSTNNTLSGLRDAINAANAGVTASLVDTTGTGQFKLSLSSTQTGAANRVQLVETTATGTDASLGLTAVSTGGTDFTQLDAQLTVGGIAITRSTNTISDALPEVTLNLKATGAASVNVTTNTGPVGDTLQAFVNAYNEVQAEIDGQYKLDAKGRPTGVLVGDPTLREVQRQMRESLQTVSTSNGGPFTRLTEIGVVRDSLGKLKLDRTVFDKQVKDSPGGLADVRALLAGMSTGQTGLAQNFTNVYTNLSDGVKGTVQAAIKGYETSSVNIDKQLAQMEARIEILRASLTKQFSIADAAIGQLNGQGTALTNVLKALEPRSR